MRKKQGGRLTPRRWAGLLLRQPPRGLYRQPAVYMCGDEMEIEHFRRILLYDEERLCVELRHGRFTVYGSGLKIRTLAAHRLTLRGNILRTDYSDL